MTMLILGRDHVFPLCLHHFLRLLGGRAVAMTFCGLCGSDRIIPSDYPPESGSTATPAKKQRFNFFDFLIFSVPLWMYFLLWAWT